MHAEGDRFESDILHHLERSILMIPTEVRYIAEELQGYYNEGQDPIEEYYDLAWKIYNRLQMEDGGYLKEF